jgi:hypothetical protein
MSTGERRVFGREFKLSAVMRLMGGEPATRIAEALWS